MSFLKKIWNKIAGKSSDKKKKETSSSTGYRASGTNAEELKKVYAAQVKAQQEKEKKEKAFKAETQEKANAFSQSKPNQADQTRRLLSNAVKVAPPKKTAFENRIYNDTHSAEQNAKLIEEHPHVYSAIRGLASGTSLGFSDLAEKYASKENKQALKELDERADKKDKALRLGGEIAGSLATFGISGGASKALVGGATKKVAPNTVKQLGKATEKIANSNTFKKIATKDIIKQVGEKGVTKELVEEQAKKRATSLIDRLVEDTAINATTGAALDINKSLADTDNAKDFAKEMGQNIALNTVLGGVSTFAPDVARGLKSTKNAQKKFEKSALKKGSEEVMENLTSKAEKSALSNADDVAKTVDKSSKVAKATDTSKTAQIFDLSNEKAVAKQVNDNADLISKSKFPKTAENIEIPTQNANIKSAKEFKSKLEPIPKENLTSKLDIEPLSARERKATTKSLQGGSYVKTPELNTNKINSLTDRTSLPFKAKNIELDTTGKETTDNIIKRTDEHVNPTIIKENVDVANVDVANDVKAQRTADKVEKEYRNTQELLDEAAKTTDNLKRSTSPDYIKKNLNEPNTIHNLSESQKEETDTLFRGLYKKKHAKEELAKANARVETSPESIIRELNRKLTNSEKLTDDDLFNAVACLNRSESLPMSEDTDFLQQQCLSVIQEFNSNSGQALAMAKYAMKQTPQGKINSAIKKITSELNRMGRAGEETFDKLLSLDKANGGELNDILEKLGIATDEAEYGQLLDSLTIKVMRQVKPSLLETINTIRHLCMLTNPTTHMNNILGNIGSHIMNGIDDIFEQGLQKIVKNAGYDIDVTTTALGSEDRKVVFGLDKESELAKFVNEQLENDLVLINGESKYDGLKKGMNQLGREFKYDNPFLEALHKVANGLGKISDWNAGLLEKEDKLFYAPDYRNFLIKALKANNYDFSNTLENADDVARNNEILREARAQAVKKAQELTFKTNNKLSKAISKYRLKGYAPNSSIANKAGAMAIDSAFPYTKVPLNIGAMTLKHSPISFASAALNARKAINSGDAQAFNKACEQLSAGLTGAGLAAIGALLLNNGVGDDKLISIIPVIPDNAEGDYQKDKGAYDYDLVIGDYHISLSNLSPISAVIVAGATLKQKLQELDGAENLDIADIADIISSYITPLSSMTILDNLNNLIESGKYARDEGGNWSMIALESGYNYAGQFIPSPVRRLAKATAPYDLDISAKGKSEIDTALQRHNNRLVQGIPVLNARKLAPKVDSMGYIKNEKKDAGDYAKALAKAFFDPLNVRKINYSNEEKEMLRLQDKGAIPNKFEDWSISVGSAHNKDYPQIKKEEFDLTAKERAIAQKARSKGGKDGAEALVKKGYFGAGSSTRAKEFVANMPTDIRKALQYVMATPEYQNASDETKKQMLNKLWDSQKKASQRGVYVDAKGNSKVHFDFVNLSAREQANYPSNYVTEKQWVDFCNNGKKERYDEEDGNSYSFTKASMIAYLKAHPELSYEQVEAMYNAAKPKNAKAFSGLGSSGGGRRKRSSGGSRKKKSTKSNVQASKFKAKSTTYKNAFSNSATKKSGSDIVKLSPIKITPPRKN